MNQGSLLALKRENRRVARSFFRNSVSDREDQGACAVKRLKPAHRRDAGGRIRAVGTLSRERATVAVPAPGVRQHRLPATGVPQRRQVGCRECAKESRRAFFQERAGGVKRAEADMRSVGLEPLEPYLNSQTPWRCRCAACGVVGKGGLTLTLFIVEAAAAQWIPFQRGGHHGWLPAEQW
ncbi:hypothetical protein ACFUGD_30120 [Streptomyces sp. NPDC057217]|uniref:hypothetical protein n=1 Tax=Streptomyces sp. NPDC057217 TaxID=3346054 RepID=UPI0036285BF3